MKTKTYLIVCAALSVVVVVGVLFVPGVSDTIEGLVLGFLSSNAG